MRLTLIFFIFCRVCFSQTYLTEVEKAADFFKNLPPTKTLRAPEFDIQIKYLCKFDPVANSLVIREISQEPLTGAFHFDQGILEFPLDELNAESIVIEDDTDDDQTPLLRLRIIHPTNSPMFTQYWMRENKIVFVQIRDEINLGPWKKTDNVLAILNNVKSLIISAAKLNPGRKEELINKKPEIYAQPTLRMKVQEKTVTTMGISKDPDPKLPNGYYMFQSVDVAPKLVGAKNESSSLSELNKRLKDYFRKKNIEVLPEIWVMISIDEMGNTQLIQVIPRNVGESSISLSDLEGVLKWTPGNYNGENVKTKYFITTE